MRVETEWAPVWLNCSVFNDMVNEYSLGEVKGMRGSIVGDARANLVAPRSERSQCFLSWALNVFLSGEEPEETEVMSDVSKTATAKCGYRCLRVGRRAQFEWAGVLCGAVVRPAIYGRERRIVAKAM